MTKAFYSGVHYAKALALKQSESKTRQERYHDFYSRMFRSYTAVPVSLAYERLRTAGEKTRYFLYMPPKRSVVRLVAKDLARISAVVQTLCR